MMLETLIAALRASVLLGGMIAMPVSEEEAPKYEIGDVDMDGEVTMLDAQLALTDFLEYGVIGQEHTLTEEQLVLADVTDHQIVADDRTVQVTSRDALYILQVAVLRLTGYEDVTIGNLDEYRSCLNS